MVYHILIDISACVMIYFLFREQKKKNRKSAIPDNRAQESDESSRLLLDYIKDYAIFLIDPLGKVAAWNPGAEYLKGYTAEEIIGKKITTFYTSDDIERNIPYRSLTIAKERGRFETEGWRVRKDGSLFWANVVLTSLWDDLGKLKGYAKVTRDVTLNKKLSDQVGYLAGLVEQSTDAIVSVGLDGGIISWNRGAEIFFGFKEHEVLGQKILPFGIVVLADHKLADVLFEILETGCWQSEMNFKRTDGSVFFGAINANLSRNQNNEIVALVFFVKDISHRKQLEKELNEYNIRLEYKIQERTEEIYKREQLFRALIENSVDGIALFDTFSNVVYLSPGSEKITGKLQTENPIGRTHPEDLQSIKTKISETLHNPGVPILFQGRFQHSDGHYLWLEGTFTNMLQVEGIWAVISNFRDVTERKAVEQKLVNSEQLYRNLFENMLNGFAYCKCIFKDGKLLDFTYQAVNSEYELQTGMQHVVGRNLSELMPGLLDSNPEYRDIVGQVALTGKSARAETYIESMDRWFAISLFSPSSGYFVSLLDNITERKKSEHKAHSVNVELEKRVIRRTQQLKEKNDEMEAFSYSVSHDLRAPLRGIIGFTTILEEEYTSKLDDEARRLTAVIKNNTEKMGNLIDDLLTFSRMGRHEIIRTAIDTNGMIENVIQELQQKTTHSVISWIIHPMQSMYGDIHTMRQVWVNLISNAIKYSAVQTVPKIEISSFQNQDQIVFRVSDNGVGFDPKYTDKLFKVFQRLHGTNEFEGTGVGLAIVEKIISRHGGKVWAEGEVAKGASFYFSMPAK